MGGEGKITQVVIKLPMKAAIIFHHQLSPLTGAQENPTHTQLR